MVNAENRLVCLSLGQENLGLKVEMEIGESQDCTVRFVVGSIFVRLDALTPWHLKGKYLLMRRKTTTSPLFPATYLCPFSRTLANSVSFFVFGKDFVSTSVLSLVSFRFTKLHFIPRCRSGAQPVWHLQHFLSSYF
jgi:hypothetical protein